MRIIVGKHLARCGIGHCDVVGISGERDPAERTFALTEQRSHIFRHEAGNVKRVLHACTLRLHADVVAVVERDCTTLSQREQAVIRLRFGLDDGRQRTLDEVGREFGLSRERIRQIEKVTLLKLRHPSRAKRLEAYAS